MSSKRPKLLCVAILMATLAMTTACGEALEEQEAQPSTITLALDQGDMPQPDPFTPKARLNASTLTHATRPVEGAQWHLIAARMGMLR